MCELTGENKNLSHASSRSLDSSPVVTLSSERTLHYGGTDRRVEAADDYDQATAVELLQSAVTVPAAQNGEHGNMQVSKKKKKTERKKKKKWKKKKKGNMVE